MEILTFFLQAAGSAVLTVLAFVGLAPTKLGEKFLNHHLDRKLAAMKHDHNSQIEELRALLTRASRVHERQDDTLSKLYRHCFDAQEYLKRMASTIRLGSEPSEDEYRRLFADSIASARDTLSDGRLFIPPDLAEQCDRFFVAIFQGHTHLDIAQHPMTVAGHQRAGFWAEAQKTAYEEVPSILRQIERAARNVIHGEPPATY